MNPDLLAFALVLLDVALILTAALLVPIALVRRLLPHRAEPTALRCCAVAGPAADRCPSCQSHRIRDSSRQPTAQRFPSDRLAVAVYPLQYMGEEVVQDFV